MIVVTVELHSVITHKTTLLGKMIIANDGTGGSDLGNYNVKIGKEGESELVEIWCNPERVGHVKNYRRYQQVWALVVRALRSYRS